MCIMNSQVSSERHDEVAITNEGESEGLIKSVTAADFGILLSENNSHIFTLSHIATYYIPSHLHATDILQ